MSSEDYGTESFETTRSSEDAAPPSESDHYTDHLYPLSEIEREIADEHYDDFKTHVEMLVEIGKKELKPLKLIDCYTSERPGMYLEILPKIMFETVETETGIEEIDFPKPIFRLTIDQGTIASVEHTSSSAQTLRSKLVNSWSQYEPRLCSEEESISTVKNESFNSFIKTAEEGVLESLVQNKIADSFFWELESLQGEGRNVEASKESILIMKGSFVCLEGDQKQIIKSISWHPVFKDIFIASTLSNREFEKRTLNSLQAQDESYIYYTWSCKNQFMPKIFLEYFDEIILHKFNPTIPNLVVGGSLGGQLILWNIDEEILSGVSDEEKTDNKFTGMNIENIDPAIVYHSAVSNPDHNHVRGITDFMWIPNHFEVSTRGNVKVNANNESYQIATCGLDGILKFWDLRAAFQNKPGFSISKMYRQLDGKWEPFHSVDIFLEEEKKYLSVTRFAFRESQTAVKIDDSEDDTKKDKIQICTDFYAGSDDGQVFCGNFKLGRDDTGKLKSLPPEFFKSPHSGPITAISLSPFISDIFLSTGSRTVAIWKHDIKATPIYFRDMHTYITSAEWSNTRPALFIVGYQDGSIEMWDLLNNIYEPALIHFVSTTSITAISVQTLADEENVVGVGDSEGIAYILSLPPSLCMPVDNELILMVEFFKREGKRVQSNLTDAPKSAKSSRSISKIKTEKRVSTRKKILTDEILQKNYDEFLELEQIQLKYLGILKEHKENEETVE